MYVDAVKLLDLSNKCLMQVGVPKDEASVISEVMLEADMREIHSHGFMRLPVYIERIQKGLIRSQSKITTENDSANMTLLDGHFSAGQVVASRSMEIAIEKAKNTGIGLAVVRNSNHFGIGSYYSMMAADAGMIGIVISNVAPLMPPVGGAEKVIGNNPISIAVPNDPEPTVLDMALSSTAFGKILYAQENGQKIPEGWGLNSQGCPTTEPGEVINGGFLSPVGGPKGFGLALMAEMLTGVLSGGDFSKMIPSMYDLTKKQSISHFMLSIDINKIIPIEKFKASSSILSNFIKEAERSTETDNIYMPGEIEFLKSKANKKRGVPVEDNILNKLTELSKNLKVDF